MTNKHSIVINGQHYDAVTGLPFARPQQAAESSRVSHTTPSHALHAAPQRSITLRRKAIKKPVNPQTAIHKRPTLTHQPVSVRTHSDVRKFAPHPAGALSQHVKVQQNKIMDIGPVAHPHVVKAHAHSAAKSAAPATHMRTAQQIKQQAVERAVASTHKSGQPVKTRVQPKQRIIAVVSAVFALVILGSYLTYLNMPSLSVRVAAAQAGINANYPNYRPDGYALNGPVTYSDGRVSMNFKSNGGDQSFVINQSKSGWNNEAVLDNYVTPKAGSGYVPYTERGLTIYTYDDNAAWVNGGILYTLEGNAPLSSEQIRRIATSLL